MFSPLHIQYEGVGDHHQTTMETAEAKKEEEGEEKEEEKEEEECEAVQFSAVGCRRVECLSALP